MRGVHSPRKILTWFIAAGVVFLIVGYTIFEGQRLLRGPQITIDSPKDGSATSSSTVVISGTAQNISFLTINDAPAFTDEAGHFALTVSPPAGYTVFTVASADRFGRRISKSVSINVLNYCPRNNS